MIATFRSSMERYTCRIRSNWMSYGLKGKAENSSGVGSLRDIVGASDPFNSGWRFGDVVVARDEECCHERVTKRVETRA